MAIRPLFGWLACAAMTESSSAMSRTGAEIASTAREAAAALKGFSQYSAYGADVRLNSIAILATGGAISLSSSTHLPVCVGSETLKPVTLPPGREKLATKPMPSGSESAGKMMGMVRVCSSNAAVLRVVLETMRSGCSDELLRKAPDRVRIGGCCPANVDPGVAAFCPPELLESVPERCDQSLPRTTLIAHQHPNQPHPLWLLRARRDRPRGHAANERDHLAPSELMKLHPVLLARPAS